jgi:hypothetical protein
MKSSALKSGFLLLARSISSSDWLNCCERSLAGGNPGQCRQDVARGPSHGRWS